MQHLLLVISIPVLLIQVVPSFVETLLRSLPMRFRFLVLRHKAHQGILGWGAEMSEFDSPVFDYDLAIHCDRWFTDCALEAEGALVFSIQIRVLSYSEGSRARYVWVIHEPCSCSRVESYSEPTKLAL